MAKKRMPIYEIIDIVRSILAYYLAKYQYFSMRPGLFDNYHQITYSLQFSVQYHVKCVRLCTKMPFSQFAIFSKVRITFWGY